jgi:prevent-host-death family protein
MLDITQDIQPLTTFRNNSVKMIKQLKKTGRPIVLTVNGKPEAAVLSAAAYQRLLDLASAADEREGLRQALEDLAANRTYPAEQVFSEIRKKYALPR